MTSFGYERNIEENWNLLFEKYKLCLKYQPPNFGASITYSAYILSNSKKKHCKFLDFPALRLGSGPSMLPLHQFGYYKQDSLFHPLMESNQMKTESTEHNKMRNGKIYGKIKWSSTLPVHTLMVNITWKNLTIVAWGFSSSRTWLSLDKNMRGN